MSSPSPSPESLSILSQFKAKEISFPLTLIPRDQLFNPRLAVPAQTSHPALPPIADAFAVIPVASYRAEQPSPHRLGSQSGRSAGRGDRSSKQSYLFQTDRKHFSQLFPLRSISSARGSCPTAAALRGLTFRPEKPLPIGPFSDQDGGYLPSHSKEQKSTECTSHSGKKKQILLFLNNTGSSSRQNSNS